MVTLNAYYNVNGQKKKDSLIIKNIHMDKEEGNLKYLMLE